MSTMSPSHCPILLFLSIAVQQVSLFSTDSEPDHLSCATTKDDVSEAGRSIVSRVVGGRNATYAPYQIIFAWAFKSNLSVVEAVCGGTILNKRYILTAAHCLDDRNGSFANTNAAVIKVVVGELNWCKAIGLDPTGDLRYYYEAAPIFKQDFESVKDISEVHVHPNAKLKKCFRVSKTFASFREGLCPDIAVLEV